MAWSVDEMRVLAEAWDARLRRDMSRFDRLVPEAEERGSVLREPASEEQVAAAEERLGLRLPDSYRSFLLVSNGAHASSLGPELAGRQPPHGLLPVEEVVPSGEGDPDGVRIWCGMAPDLNDPENDVTPEPGRPQEVRYYAPYRDGLLVSRMLDTSRMALVPRAGEPEWELWEFHWEGAAAFPSFADHLQWQVAKRDLRPRRERADDYAAAFTAGKSYTLDMLAEVDAPRAAALAVEAVEAGSQDSRIAATLGRIGDPAHIPVLRELSERPGPPQLRAAALHALDRIAARREEGAS